MGVTAAEYVKAARDLLGHAKLMPIPYVNNGHTLAGMDCQGLAEYLLEQCGVDYTECNRAGSNSHLRDCVWRGTPEECVNLFGKVPDGAWIFIVKDNGGEPEKYRGDGIGNAEHMGVYMSGTSAIHSSSSRNGVAESFFDGKTIPNGGWNMVGFCQWVDYGIGSVSKEQNKPPDKRIAYVISENGKPVHLRRDPSTNKPYLAKINVGTAVDVISSILVGSSEWAKVRTDGKTGYMQRKFLSGLPLEETPTTPPSPEHVTVTLERQMAEKVLGALQAGLQRGDGNGV
ncbi:MAG: hypothetical protein J6K73_04920 [Clostridia bacterium]|nr:hypothetical protein [Clostridia bacterium]